MSLSPADQFLDTILSCLYAALSTYSGYECYHLNNESNHESTIGYHVRKFFFLVLTASSITRALFLIIESYTSYNNNCSSIFSCILIRLFPQILFAAVYTVLVFYLALTYYDVIGSSILNIESLYLTSSVALSSVIVAIFLLVIFGFFPLQVFYLLMGLVYFAIFIGVAYFSYKLYQQMPSSSVLGKKIMTKFYPLIIVCLVATLLSTIYYSFAATEVALWPYAYPPNNLLLFDFFLFLIIEFIPFAAIVVLTFRREKEQLTNESAGGNTLLSKRGFGPSRQYPPSTNISQTYNSFPLSENKESVQL